MTFLQSGFELEQGEELVIELQGELWARSQNPLARVVGSIKKFLNLLIGNKRKGYLVITNKRVIEIKQDKVCWCFNAAKQVKYLLPSSITELGYKKQATFLGCFCQAYELYYESLTQSTSWLLKEVDSDENAVKIVNGIYRSLYKAQ